MPRASGALGIVALAAALAGGAAQAQDALRGRQLYETHCSGCHDERVLERSREASRVRSLEGLRAEVTRWAGQTGNRFTREDVEDIVAYLNASHYRFER